MDVIKKKGKKLNVVCEKKEDGVGYCKIEEKNGEGWAEIEKAPNEEGELETIRLEGSPKELLDIAKEVADKHLSPRSRSVIR